LVRRLPSQEGGAFFLQFTPGWIIHNVPSPMIESLKAAVCQANQALVPAGLVRLTWGNVSGFDPDTQLWCIKPSGVDYADLTPDTMVVLDLDGRIVEGHLKPSSDTKTHLQIYRAFPEVRGITHTHSLHATMFAQASKPLPCLGTTHADHFFGEIPIVRSLTAEEVSADYEHLTGIAIVERFKELGLTPLTMPAVLQAFHAPFTFGTSPMASVHNSIALEMCAQMALGTLSLHQLSQTPSPFTLPDHLLQKHFLRKHGAGAYYGQ
jgi:L-ribulose-5-phosphate 4-epimerase